MLETSIVLAIYEAAIAKGYERGATIDYERSYPKRKNVNSKRKSVNPKRADLALKDGGKGKNWGYVEVKCYGPAGKKAVKRDIRKLRSIEQRSQRWIMCYRVQPITGRSQSLKDLLIRHFDTDLSFEYEESVPTIASNHQKGRCDIVLARVK